MALSNSQWLANPGVTYEIEQSIRFNKLDDAKLTQTFGTATNRRKFTLSVWQKNGSSAGSMLEYNGTGGVTWANITIGAGGRVDIFDYSSGSARIDLRTTRVFRDPSAWVHLVVAFDTTQGTAANRIKVYINGTQETSFGTETYPSQDFDGFLNSAVEHLIGEGTNGPFDGYIAEYYFIDGQQLGPDSFGETNDDGVWIPKDASSLTFGTNGFYLKGQDSSALGDDSSGNGNDFTSSGLAAADQMLDTPTNNMPTLNTLSSGTGTVSDGNLQYVGVSGNWSNSRLNLLVPDTGKWAIRCKTTTSYDQMLIGLCAPDSASPYTDIDVNGVAQIRYNARDGNFVTRVGGSLVNDTGPATTSAQTFIQLLFDMDNGKMGIAADGATSGTFADISTYSALDLNGDLSAARQPFVQAFSGTDSGAGVIIDAGQSGWTTTVTGFKNLILANLDTPSIKDGSKYFQSTLYSGNGSTQSITNGGNSDLQPDLVWIKNRDATDSHVLTDSVRGATKIISSDATTAESTDADTVTSFATDGFALGDDDKVNTSSENYVAWQWKEGSTPGFDIVTDTGTGSAHTISHSLGVTPEFILRKDRTATSDPGWIVWHKDLGGANYYLNLHDNGARDTSVNYWNNTLPTSSVFSVGASNGTNQNTKTFVTYLFNSVPGFSSIGSYTGNGNADGSFIYTGFPVSWVMAKRIAGSGGHFDWWLFDAKRPGFNLTNERLHPNNTQATDTGAGSLDLVSNGFKIRTSTSSMNNSGDTIIYMAFAENPFGGDGAAPVTAR